MADWCRTMGGLDYAPWAWPKWVEARVEEAARYLERPVPDLARDLITGPSITAS